MQNPSNPIQSAPLSSSHLAARASCGRLPDVVERVVVDLAQSDPDQVHHHGLPSLTAKELKSIRSLRWTNLAAWSLLPPGIFLLSTFVFNFNLTPFGMVSDMREIGVSMAFFAVVAAAFFALVPGFFILSSELNLLEERCDINRILLEGVEPTPSFWGGLWKKARVIKKAGSRVESFALGVLLMLSLVVANWHPMGWIGEVGKWEHIILADKAMGGNTPLGNQMRARMVKGQRFDLSMVAPQGFEEATVLSPSQAMTAHLLRQNAMGLTPGLDFVLQNGLVRPEDKKDIKEFITRSGHRLTQDQKTFIVSLMDDGGL